MIHFEKGTKDSKEENIVMEEESAAKSRFLRMWLKEEEDTKVRIQRTLGSWSKMKKKPKHSRLTTRTEARVVEVIVESTRRYNCSTRS